MGDLRGFTSFSEAHPAEVVLEVLNDYLIEMSRVIVRHGGMVDKFMGDSVMALFGAHSAAHDDVRRAVACAVEMQVAMMELNARHKESGMPPVFNLLLISQTQPQWKLWNSPSSTRVQS